MDSRNKKKKEILERRLEEYYVAETKILQGQEYSIGSRQLKRTDLSKVQEKIKELENALDALERYGSNKRKMRRVIPVD